MAVACVKLRGQEGHSVGRPAGPGGSGSRTRDWRPRAWAGRPAGQGREPADSQAQKKERGPGRQMAVWRGELPASHWRRGWRSEAKV